MTTHPALYAALALTVFLAGTTLSTRCLAQVQSIEESLNIFSDTDNQKKYPANQIKSQSHLHQKNKRQRVTADKANGRNVTMMALITNS